MLTSMPTGMPTSMPSTQVSEEHSARNESYSSSSRPAASAVPAAPDEPRASDAGSSAAGLTCLALDSVLPCALSSSLNDNPTPIVQATLEHPWAEYTNVVYSEVTGRGAAGLGDVGLGPRPCPGRPPTFCELRDARLVQWAASDDAVAREKKARLAEDAAAFILLVRPDFTVWQGAGTGSYTYLRLPHGDQTPWQLRVAHTLESPCCDNVLTKAGHMRFFDRLMSYRLDR
jgi:hypothetical protein